MKRRTVNTRARQASIPALLFLALALASCKEGPFYTALGDQITTTALSIAPASASIPQGSSLTFTASGGTPPYAYSIVSGSGAVIASTGAFTANGAAGPVVIRVTDKNKKTSDATLTVTSTAGLAINPSIVNVGPNGTIQFVASGGTLPYTFSHTLTGPGSPSLDTATGLYVAGAALGTDNVTVTDSAASLPSTSVVTITPTVTNVDYTITTTTVPATGKGGMSIPAGYSFIVKNVGTLGGTQALDWWVYISDTTLNAAGTQILASSLTGTPLVSSGTITIPITGTWPVVPIPAGATKNLYLMVAATDDLNSTNNIAGPFPVVLSPPNVDYTATAPTHTGPLIAGGPINESFTLQNIGTDPGSRSVQWTAYVSSNNAASISGDTAISAGTYSIPGPIPASIGITGTWPGAHGAYYLKVKLSAADDVNSANDIQVSTVYNTTYIDLTPLASTISSTGGQVAGGPLNGQFKIQNLGTADTTQPIAWTAYVAPVLTPSAVTYVASGSFPGPVAAMTTTPAFIPFAGTWPTATGTYVLIVTLSSPEDTVPGNNTQMSVLGYGTVPPSIDYAVSSVSSSGTQVAGGPINGGTFTVQSIGSAGAATIYWTAYVSTDSTATIDGGAKVISSGTISPAGPFPVSPGITGTWPSAPGGPYYLKVKISAADDINSANDVQVSPGYTTTHVDYTPVNVQLSAAGQVAGGPIGGEFQIQNVGNANGSQPITWTAYVAPALTPNLVTFLATGSFPGPVNALTTTAFIPFAGTWPSTPAAYVLTVSLSSPEDTVPGNNAGSSAGYGVAAPHVNYAVSAVTNTGAATAAVQGAASGSFHLANGGPDKGTQYVSWVAYASESGAVDSSAVLVATGTTPPLASSGSANIPFNGQWPIHYGNYQLVVSVSVPVDVDTDLSNNVAASGSTAAVGFINETEANDTVATAQNLGLTLQPGMSVQVTRLAGGSDQHDVFAFNTGTAASVSLYMSWSGNQTVTLSFYKDSVTQVPPSSTTVLGASDNLTWTRDATSAPRWIDVQILAGETPYTLVIAGN